MNRPGDTITNPISDWLDDFVAGKSTPRPESTADSELSALCTTARQFHGLAHAGEQYAATDSSLPATWEQLMNTHGTSMDARSLLPNTGPSPHPQETAPFAGIRSVAGRIPWNTAANLLLAAALLLALTAGIWRAVGGITPGGGGDQEPVPFGGLTAEDQDGNLDPADLPTAEDCTVEPLTVDEVIWYIQDVDAAWSFASPEQAGTPVVYPPSPGTPLVNPVGGPASVTEIEAVASLQRMWAACVLAESPFQVWALESPYWVRQQLMWYFPSFTSREEAKGFLEALEADGSAALTGRESVLLGTTCSAMPLISTDPSFSWKPGSDQVWVRPASYNLDGTLHFPALEPDEDHDVFSFHYEWNEARKMWWITSMPNCG